MFIINLNFLKKYDVALSFAEENRAFVDVVAQLLKDKGVKVYYDKDQRVASLGKDLITYLDKVYRVESKFCVVFVSKFYEPKQWTNFEIERARARSYFSKREGYVLPYLLDDSSFAKGFRRVGCLTYETHDEHQLAETIKEKLDRQPERRLAFWFQRLYRNKVRLAMLIVLLTGSTLMGLKEHLTPVSILSNQLHEESKRKIEGSICRDGSTSRSRGSGTCSGHGGVADEKEFTVYDKTLEECRKEAEEISWLSPWGN